MSRLHLLIALGLTTCAAAVSAEVNVRFLAPEQFTDTARSGDFGRPDTGRTLTEIRQHITGLGERCIPRGQMLEVVIRDIDLAGQQVPRRGTDGEYVRSLTGVSNPRIDLDYVWRLANGTVRAKGSERLSDANFLPQRVREPRVEDPLHYEKLMLTKWFEGRFCQSEKAPGK